MKISIAQREDGAVALVHRQGSMLLEFVLTMPILMMLIMLVLQFAMIVTVRPMVSYAAFCAARSTLCANPVDSLNSDWRENCAFHAARRALAWVTILGTEESQKYRSFDTENIKVGSSDFADIGDTSTESFVTVMYGDENTHDVVVPGWGQVPESNSVDKRLSVKTNLFPGRSAAATVVYNYPLLIPIAGQMIGWLTRHSWKNSAYVKSGTLQPGWFDEVEDAGLIDGVPFITLTETCVLPLPYSPDSLPLNAFDYLSYD